MTDGSDEKRVCVGVIASAHGIKGEVNIHPFMEDAGFFLQHSLYTDKTGDKGYNIRIKGQKKRLLIAAIEGVNDRNRAELLRGTELYVPRDALPEASAEEFYYEDLVGLEARIAGQERYGVVKALYNFGAGDVIEIQQHENGKLVLLPFTKEVVPEISVAGGYVVINPPEVIKGKDESSAGEA